MVSPFLIIAQLKKSNNMKEGQIKLLNQQIEELKKEVNWLRSRKLE